MSLMTLHLPLRTFDLTEITNLDGDILLLVQQPSGAAQ